jgi:hypothetical protein
MTAQNEKSIICNKPRLTALHAGIVLTLPLEVIQTALFFTVHIAGNANYANNRTPKAFDQNSFARHFVK